MEIQTVLLKMMELFLLLGVGYAANKAGFMDGETNRKLSRVVINLSMPALIFSSVAGEGSAHGAGEVLWVIFLAVICYLPAGLLCLFVPRALGIAKADAGLYRFMMLFGNVGFMGFPVVAAIFGGDAVFYASLVNIPFNLLVFSVGILLMSGGGGGRFNPRLLVNIPLVASAAALLCYLTQLRPPQVILGAAAMLGQVTTPAAMLIIGSTLASVPVASIFSEWRLYPLALLRLILVPLALWFALTPLVSDRRLLGILITIAAMPVATNATMMCVEYGGDQAQASKGIFITTLLSAATIPALAYLMM